MTELTVVPALDAPARGHRAIFLVTSLGAFMASLDLSIVNVAFPALERAFAHDSRASLAWVVTGYSIVFGALLVVAGRTADRIGSRRVFFAGLAIFTAGSTLCAIAPSAALLIAGRLVQGAGAAAILPASLSLLLSAYPLERRSHVVTLWGGVGALAVATGPSLGAVLITGLGWRSAFFVNLPVSLVAWLVGRRVLVDARAAHSPARPDYPGVALLTGSLAALVLAIAEGPSWGWSHDRVLGSFAIAVTLGGLFLTRSARHPEPVLDLSLFTHRRFALANTAMLLYAMGFFAMLLGNILFLTSVWHHSILWAGLAITPSPLIVAAVSGPVGRVATRIGFRPILLAGAVVYGFAILWFYARAGLATDYLGVWLPGSLVLGLGVGLTFPVLSAAAVSTLPPGRFAVGAAVSQTARQVGGAVGVAVLVAILGAPRNPADALAGFQHLWLYIAVMTTLTGTVAGFLGRSASTPVTSVAGTSSATSPSRD